VLAVSLKMMGTACRSSVKDSRMAAALPRVPGRAFCGSAEVVPVSSAEAANCCCCWDPTDLNRSVQEWCYGKWVIFKAGVGKYFLSFFTPSVFMPSFS